MVTEPAVEDGDPPLPPCGKCGGEIAEQADADLSLLRRLWRDDDTNEPVPLCRACGIEEYEAKASTPRRTTAGVGRAPAVSDDEVHATTPTGTPVGVIPPPSDDALRGFLEDR